jgi:magnesium-transporting ATPase (P-type)
MPSAFSAMPSATKEVITTFLIDSPVMVILGMLYTLMEREPEKPFYRTKTFLASCQLAGVFLALVVVSYVLFPDWMWMYFIGTKDLSLARQVSLLGAVLWIIYIIPFLAGYFWGQAFRAKSKMAWWAGILVNLALEGLLIFTFWDRYRVIGTRDEFFHGTAVSIAEFQLPGVLLTSGGVLLVIFGIRQWWRLRRT